MGDSTVLPEMEKTGARFCARPFTVAQIDGDGTVRCCPEAWQRAKFGSLRDQTLADTWNSPSAQQIRKSILDGTYTHCNRYVCPRLKVGALGLVDKADVQDPALREDIDKNLTELPHGPLEVFADYGQSADAEALQSRVPSALGDARVLHLSNACDPFKSPANLAALQHYDWSQHPNLKIKLICDGQSLTPGMWESIKNSHAVINTIHINVDAASPKTYALAHKGARFGRLLRNLYFISRLRRSGKINAFTLGFDVTRHNFREMARFVPFAMDFGADLVYFDLRRAAPGDVSLEIARNAMLDPTHPFYDEFRAVLGDSTFRDLKVRMGSLDEYVNNSQRFPAIPHTSRLRPAARAAYRYFVIVTDMLSPCVQPARRILRSARPHVATVLNRI